MVRFLFFQDWGLGSHGANEGTKRESIRCNEHACDIIPLRDTGTERALDFTLDYKSSAMTPIFLYPPS